MVPFSPRSFLVPAVVALAVFSAACTSTQRVGHVVEVPAQMSVPADVTRVAVSRFDGLEQTGTLVANRLAEGLLDGGRYRVYERAKIDELLGEHAFNRSGVVDPETVRELRLAGVDALIFGVVDVYSIDDQRGTSRTTRTVGTGRYREVEEFDRKTGETTTREVEITRTETWDRPTAIRTGTMGVTFRMTNLSTGEIMAVEALTANFREVCWADLPDTRATRDQILDRLTSRVVDGFLGKIQPRDATLSLVLENAGNSRTRLGLQYAANRLWSRALGEFDAAMRAEPEEPSGPYNVAIAHFALGHHDEARRFLERAIAIEPKARYISALAMVEDAAKRGLRTSDR